MFKKFLLQCSLATLLLITTILTLNHFTSDILLFAKNTITTINNYALNNHHMSEEALKFFSDIDGEVSGLCIIFFGTCIPLFIGAASTLIHHAITFTCEVLTGFHADNFQIHNYNKNKINKTTKNLLTLRYSQIGLVVLTGATTALTLFPLTPLYLLNSLTTFACCLALALGHSCLTFKYINLLINNTCDKDVLDVVQKNQRIANDTIFYLKNDKMHLVSTETHNETKKLKLATVGDEKFEKP